MSHHESAATGPDGRLVDRMLFFSDAVFAIVLTLMALELRPPEVGDFTDAAFWSALAGMGSHFAAFLMSFALIGLWWLIHMRVTRKLIAFDWPTAICNLLVLACLTLIPFASAVFGSRLESLATLQVYWTISAATAFAMLLMFVVMTRGKARLIGGMSAGEWRFRLIQSAAPAISFAAGVYFCATGQVWFARFAAFIMFPIMMLGALFHRAPKRPSAAR